MSANVSIPKAGAGADLRKFMEKRLDLKLNGNRHVVGVLRGYDQFMNLVLDNAVLKGPRTHAGRVELLCGAVGRPEGIVDPPVGTLNDPICRIFHFDFKMLFHGLWVSQVELVSRTEKKEIGMTVIRGNSVLMWECLDRVTQ